MCTSIVSIVCQYCSAQQAGGLVDSLVDSLIGGLVDSLVDSLVGGLIGGCDCGRRGRMTHFL